MVKDEELLDQRWDFIEFISDDQFTLQLEFDNPLEISQNEPRDQLLVVFNSFQKF